MFKNTWKKLSAYLFRYRYLILLSLLMAMFSVIVALYVPILIGRIIDALIGQNRVDLSYVSEILLSIGIYVLLSAFAQYLMGRINNRIGTHP